MVRRWCLGLLRFLLEQRKARGAVGDAALIADAPIASGRVPLLVYAARGGGRVVSCGIEMFSSGLGRLVPDVGRMALTPVTARFLAATETAWEAAARCRWELRCIRDPSTLDAHWWVDGYQEGEAGDAVLRGSSQGAAVAGALALLFAGARPLSAVTASAGISLSGDLVPVGNVREKTTALLRAHGPPIRALVLHPQNAAEGRAALQDAGEAEKPEIFAARTLPELLPHAGALDLLRRFARAELDWLAAEAGRRIGRSYASWSEFQDDHLQRAVRRVHEPEPTNPEDWERDGGGPGQGAAAWSRVAPRMRKALLLGPAGAGKTVLLWNEVGRRCVTVADQLARGAAPPDQVEPSFYCRAAEAAERIQGLAPTGRVFVAALAEAARRRHSLSEAFRESFTRMALEGRMFVALDALDEVPRPARGDLIDALRALAEDFPHARFLLSARREAYARGALPVDDVWEVVPLEMEQLEEAVGRWLPQHRATREALVRFLRSSGPAVQAMRIPLLLRIACRLAAERPPTEGQFLWRSRTDLYAAFIGELLGNWARRERDLSVDEEAAIPAFAAEAALTWRRRRLQGATAELPEVINEVQSRFPVPSGRHLTEDLCRAGLLTRSDEDDRLTFTFTHSTFGEFLYAMGLNRIVESTGWKEMQEEVSGRADDPEGQMAILFLAGLLRDPAPLLELLADPRRDDVFRHRLALAAFCLPEALNRSAGAAAGSHRRG
jgi:hypothetical protein